jgi:hypothetical protein
VIEDMNDKSKVSGNGNLDMFSVCRLEVAEQICSLSELLDFIYSMRYIAGNLL